MILLLFCFIISCAIVVETYNDKGIIIPTVVLFIISTTVVFYSHDFKMSEPEKIEIIKENIYSLNNGNSNVSGAFILGTGTIGSSETYTYYNQNQDGSKERKSVRTSETKIYEGFETPYFEQITCENGSRYSFITGLFHHVDTCEQYIQRKLFVPKDTIILNFNIK